MKTSSWVRSNRSVVILLQLSWLLSLTQCKQAPDTMFKLLSASSTGIDFINTITERDSFNILTDEYIYNGGGVAVADFNNDGLQDIFFTGNEVPNKLYLNKGHLKFEDVSEKANVNVPGRWNSGVVVVDINNDGWKDLYVCATMRKDSLQRPNMLFINKTTGKGEVVFEEMASTYGIADNGYCTMAAFFDYDRDGDLDLYILTNQQLARTPSNYRDKVINGTSPNNDRLYRNNGNNTFTNVSKEAGIIYEGYGLGLAISDFDLDGWPDIYVSNDFLSEDILYLNNRNGTFTNKTSGTIAHQSHSSMGNDAADFDNDGLPDIITLDMLPETNSRKKTTINNKTYQTYINNVQFDYEYQYIRNMLHRNNGTAGDVAFSEIGQLSGVHQTEWSWSPLFADFDNDGWKDLFITNGFPKDITDKDFSNYRADVGAYVNVSDLIDSIPVVKIPNYAYKNLGDLTFQDVTKSWGLDQPSFSNGAAFADLDNDGDLDYIVNNINSEAFLYENTLNNRADKSSHYVRIKLKGASPNLQAISTKVYVHYDQGKTLFAEQSVARGYLSSVEDILHFGLGKAAEVDSIRVIWPDGKTQRIDKVKVDQVLEIAYDPAQVVPYEFEQRTKSTPIFRVASKELNLLYKHTEEDKIDYNVQRTLPHKFTQAGPSISVGDVNNDKLDDIIIGGSSRRPLTVFTQNTRGEFSKSELSKSENNIQEAEGMLLFDADGDDDLDLYVVSGSIENEPASPLYQDQFFRNNGKGQFSEDLLALPKISASGSCVRAADFDGDNDLDLFVGGRVVPAAYPLPAESFLLRNDNGKFSNATSEWCPELSNIGMITDALFTDFDNDGKIDLVTVGEFMSVTFYKGSSSKFSKVSGTGLEDFSGWWNSISGGDFDNDGDIDYIAGNLGTNNGYQVTKEFPLKVFAKDYDKNGSVDAILACYIKESLGNNQEKKLFPVHFWDELNGQSPKFRQQFSRYRQYGSITMDKLLSEDDLKDALILQANYFESSYIENLGNGKFRMEPLPRMMQVAPINGLVVEDVNDDGNLDIIMVGNDFANEVFVGRYDAFQGAVLIGNGKGNFEILPCSKSGFKVNGDAKSLAKIFLAQGDEAFLATRNIDSLKVFVKSEPVRQKENIVALLSSDSWAELVFQNGKKSRLEFYYGSGYLSQSTRKIKVPAGVKEIVIHSYNGTARTIPGPLAGL